MSLDILLEIFASSPPSILIALGFVLLFVGTTTKNDEMVNAGWAFFAFGIVLQIAWFLVRVRR